MEENNQMIEIPQIEKKHNILYDDINSDSSSSSSSDDDDNNIEKDKDEVRDENDDMNNHNSNIIELFDENGIQIFNPNLPVGNNIILQNGNLIIGIRTELKQFLIVIISGIILFISWLIFIYPYFIYGTQFTSIGLLMLIIYCLAEFYHVMTFMTEPGIIPRNHPIYQTPFGSDIYSYVPDNPNIAEQKSCHVCGIDRPKLAYHCNSCDNCVEEYDHHCSFVANCVGKRNRKYFVYFLLFTCLFLGLIAITSAIQIIGLGYYASDFFIILFSNTYINIGISLWLCLSLISYPIFHTVIYLRYGIGILASVYIIMFYWLKAYYDLDYFVNPFGVAMFFLIMQVALIPTCMLTTQIQMISIGFTSYQYTNVIDYRIALNEASEKEDTLTIVDEIPFIKEIPDLTFTDKLNNFKFFYKRRCPPSLLTQIYKT